MTGTLYRLFSGTGELLYIGQSSNPFARVSQHSSSKPWWTSVARIDLEHFPSVEDASEAEAAAITREQPKYNIRRPETYRRPVPALAARRNLGLAASGLLLALMDDRGWTAVDVERASHGRVSQRTVHRAVRDGLMPSPSKRAIIAETFGLRPAQVWGTLPLPPEYAALLGTGAAA